MNKFVSLESVIRKMNEGFPEKKKKPVEKDEDKKLPDDSKEPAEEKESSPDDKNKEVGAKEKDKVPLQKPNSKKPDNDGEADDNDSDDAPVKLGVSNPIDFNPELKDDDKKKKVKDSQIQEAKYPAGLDEKPELSNKQIKNQSRKQKRIDDRWKKFDWSKFDWSKLKKTEIKEGAGWWRSNSQKRGHEISQEEHLETMKHHARKAREFEAAAHNHGNLKTRQASMHKQSHLQMAQLHHRQAGRALAWYMKNDPSDAAAHKAYKALKEETNDMTTLNKIKTILEARHSKGGGAKGAAGAKGQDSEGDDHIINQLRKATNLRDHHVTFKDKSKHHVPSHVAKKALEKYSGLRTTQEKDSLARRYHHSHASMHDAIAGKEAPAKKSKITLPSKPFNWREH